MKIRFREISILVATALPVLALANSPDCAGVRLHYLPFPVVNFTCLKWNIKIIECDHIYLQATHNHSSYNNRTKRNNIGRHSENPHHQTRQIGRPAPDHADAAHSQDSLA